MTRAPVLVLVVTLAGCGGTEPPPRPAERPLAMAVADSLGREGFTLLDRAVEYRNAGPNRLPRSLRQIGIDSLTPTTARWIMLDGRSPTILVARRRPGPDGIVSCAVPEAALEDAALGGGRFRMLCTLTDGATDTFTVGESR